MKTPSHTWLFPLFGSRTGNGGRRVWPAFLLVAISLLVGSAITLLVLRRPAPPATDHTGMTMPAEGEAAPPPVPNAVRISPERQQLIGVRTEVVEPRQVGSTLRTVGVLAYDESRTTEVHTKFSGWVDRLYIDFVGKTVRKGEPLFTIYSPDLVSTQNEYLIAQKAQKQAEGASPSARQVNESLVAAARKRLKLWDISDKQIEDLERTGQLVKTMTLYSPYDGVVVERKAFPGQYITPDMAAFKIADRSTIWVIGQVFEYELGRVKIGQTAEIEFPYGQTTRRLEGRIGFIYPDIDPRTRTARVRIEFKNPGLTLKPETYVTVNVKTTPMDVLAVPKEAVLDDGKRQYVLLALPNGYFAPREVKIGEAQGEFYPVAAGLVGGERVVTSAQFLVDSETNLQSAMKSMSMSMPGMKMGEGQGMPEMKMDQGKGDMKDMPMPQKAP
jgi:RND family efflux transporter MFP subunit